MTHNHKHGLYQIIDNVAEVCLGPLIKAHNHNSAMRHFSDAMRYASDNKQNAADYDLYHVGSQTDSTGEIEPFNAALIATGKQWLIQTEQRDT